MLEAQRESFAGTKMRDVESSSPGKEGCVKKEEESEVIVVSLKKDTKEKDKENSFVIAFPILHLSPYCSVVVFCCVVCE